MPGPRTLPALLLAVFLLCLVRGSAPGSGAAASYATLPLLVDKSKGRTAALLTRDETGTRFARTGPAIRSADHFRAGSITKTFIATVVLQLAAEGRLALSDPLDKHLPGRVRGHGNDGRTLTLRSLLDHTSGLYDFTALTGGTVPMTPSDVLRVAVSHPPSAAGVFAYSNTDYVLLGMVIERVTGRSYAAEARRRVIAPLGLTGTSFPGSRRTLPAPHGRARTAGGRDVTELDPRVAGAAGELVTTLSDLGRFYGALLSGRLLPPAQLAEMLDTRATGGRYGMGLYPQRLPCGVTVWGHNGRIQGSYARAAATRDGRRILVYRLDTDAVPAAAAERRVLAAEFCRE